MHPHLPSHDLQALICFPLCFLMPLPTPPPLKMLDLAVLHVSGRPFIGSSTCQVYNRTAANGRSSTVNAWYKPSKCATQASVTSALICSTIFQASTQHLSPPTAGRQIHGMMWITQLTDHTKHCQTDWPQTTATLRVAIALQGPAGPAHSPLYPTLHHAGSTQQAP